MIAKTRRNFFSDEFDSFFQPVFNTLFENYRQDADGHTVMEIEVPGFNSENLNIEITDGILTVAGKNDTKKIYKQYSIGLIEDVKADIKDGILTLTLIEPAKQVKKIQLNQIEHKENPQLEDI